jgi:hypothetical protein
MPDLTLKTVTRTQGNNQALKDGTVKPHGVAFAFEEVDPLIAAFRRMVRGSRRCSAGVPGRRAAGEALAPRPRITRVTAPRDGWETLTRRAHVGDPRRAGRRAF